MDNKDNFQESNLTARQKAQRKYHEKMKNSEEYRQKRNERNREYHQKRKEDEEYKQYKRDANKKYYEVNKEKVIQRVMNHYIEQKIGAIKSEIIKEGDIDYLFFV